MRTGFSSVRDPDAGRRENGIPDLSPRDGVTLDLRLLESRPADLTADLPHDLHPDAPRDALVDLADGRSPDLPSPDLRPPDLRPPDLRPPDLRPPDLRPPDLRPPDLRPPDGPASDLCTPVAGWWAKSYRFRRKLTINEGINGTLAAGYSVAAALDTASLVAANKLLSSGDDLRVVRQEATSVELDRRLVAPNTTSSAIWFKTQAIVDLADTTYYLYYGNLAAAAPPARWSDSMGADPLPSAVYLAADDFENDAVGSKPNGWEGSSAYSVEASGQNKVLKVLGPNNDADYLFAGDYGWTDVVVEVRLAIQKTSGDHYGLFARADGATNFDTLFFGLQTNSQLALYTCKLANASATGLTSATQKGSWNISAAGTAWHVLRMNLLGSTAELYFDGVKKTTYTISGGSMQKGRIGLCAGYPSCEATWDDVVVRKLVEPEPTVSLGAEEAGCP
jgi:hypothetical protein